MSVEKPVNWNWGQCYWGVPQQWWPGSSSGCPSQTYVVATSSAYEQKWIEINLRLICRYPYHFSKQQQQLDNYTKPGVPVHFKPKTGTMWGWPIAGLLACDMYLVLECTCFWHKIDHVYLFSAKPFCPLYGPFSSSRAFFCRGTLHFRPSDRVFFIVVIDTCFAFLPNNLILPLGSQASGLGT